MTSAVDKAITHLARHDSGRVLSLLARRYGDLSAADDAVQDALLTAAEHWPTHGIPDNPAGWLHRVARNRMIDEFRRRQTERRRSEHAARELRTISFDAGLGGTDSGHKLVDDMTVNPDLAEGGLDQPHGSSDSDERLRLMLLCCHPALSVDAQIALTLRLVAGLTTYEISAAFVVPTPTIAQRITRAKRKIATAKIPLSIPARIDERIDALLAVLFLIFNEGYLTRGPGDTRDDLCEEAIRLTELVAATADQPGEALGVAAMMRYTHARRDARIVGGKLVLLDQQDRQRWHLDEIAAANRLLGQALGRRRLGPYQLQATIAGVHANARTANDTDWTQIVRLYDQLLQLQPSAIHELNRVVAVAMADGPDAGLRVLTESQLLVRLDRYYLTHSTMAELLLRSGRATAAIGHFERALELTDNSLEREHLRYRIGTALVQSSGGSDAGHK